MKTRVIMFKEQFVSAILDGTKISTFRPIGKTIPYYPTKLDMRIWTGKPYRSKQKKFATATTNASNMYVIRPFNDELYLIEEGNLTLMSEREIEEIAKEDGFERSYDFFDFFRDNYGELELKMVRISWFCVEEIK